MIEYEKLVKVLKGELLPQESLQTPRPQDTPEAVSDEVILSAADASDDFSLLPEEDAAADVPQEVLSDSRIPSDSENPEDVQDLEDAAGLDILEEQDVVQDMQDSEQGYYDSGTVNVMDDQPTPQPIEDATLSGDYNEMPTPVPEYADDDQETSDSLPEQSPAYDSSEGISVQQPDTMGDAEESAVITDDADVPAPVYEDMDEIPTPEPEPESEELSASEKNDDAQFMDGLEVIGESELSDEDLDSISLEDDFGLTGDDVMDEAAWAQMEDGPSAVAVTPEDSYPEPPPPDAAESGPISGTLDDPPLRLLRMSNQRFQTKVSFPVDSRSDSRKFPCL